MNWLEKILENKRREVAVWKKGVSADALLEQARARPPAPDFRAALASRPIGLIAEVKRRSPSAGVIREPFDPPVIAQAYEAGGAQALSVLIDQLFFGGGVPDFQAVRGAVRLPLLYKEFVVDPWQVAQAAAIGASAVLLIVAALTEKELNDLAASIRSAGLRALVEVHDEAEAAVAVRSGADLIGVNNRNLKTFVTTLETTERVMDVIPDDRMVVSESGIRTADDVVRLRRAGADAILVGEHLLRKPDLVEAVRELMGSAWTSL